MKVKGTQTLPVDIEINEDEIYRITRDEILRVFNLPEGSEVHDGKLYLIWSQDFVPYGPELMKEEIRTATVDDILGCAVLEKLKTDYEGL